MRTLDYGFSRFLWEIRGDKFSTFTPYPWQGEWLEASSDNQEIMARAANRTGKTVVAAFAVAMHLTGIYPDWYKGRRFPKPTTVWCAGKTAETAADVILAQLLGGLGENLGTGLIPRRLLVGTPTTRQASVRNCVDRFQVRHKTGGLSTCVIKSYEMGAEKFQGAAVDVVWFDEEPNDFTLFTEGLTRVLSTSGLVFVTFTPLLGPSPLVEHFATGGPGNLHARRHLGRRASSERGGEATHVGILSRPRTRRPHQRHSEAG
jgi:phage terminase large subunit-like protein